MRYQTPLVRLIRNGFSRFPDVKKMNALKGIHRLLSTEKFDFLSQSERDFIVAFDEAMSRFGYESGGTIGSGYVWGRYMIVYSKIGIKSKKVAARIYIRDIGIVLRLFLNNIDEHREYIENAPEYIRQPFINEHGKCKHCKNETNGTCKFRKSYTLENRFIEKCNGFTFEFHEPTIKRLQDYQALMAEFYPIKHSVKI
jgi:hypothetical protein